MRKRRRSGALRTHAHRDALADVTGPESNRAAQGALPAAGRRRLPVAGALLRCDCAGLLFDMREALTVIH